MLGGVLMLVLNAVAGFLTMLLLTRALMRWLRLSFINPLGHFILAATDWLVRPVQRVLPSSPGLDLSCWVPAWGVQILVVLMASALGAGFSDGGRLLLYALSIGGLELVRSLIHLVIIVIIAAAVLSWVNPRAPMAPLVNGLARPFVAPVARHVPPVGGIDLSPLVVLLVLQVLLYLLEGVRANLTAMLLL